MNEKIERVLDGLEKRKLGYIEYGGAASSKTIAKAQILLGIKFREDYKRFLSEYGSILIGDNCLIGIWYDQAESEYSGSVVSETLRARKTWLEEKWVVILNENDEWYVLQNCEDGSLFSYDRDTEKLAPTGKNFDDYIEFFLQSFL